ncbi:MAG: SpoIIE family protein phosphatase [Pyrinomonadaceae bacterium]
MDRFVRYSFRATLLFLLALAFSAPLLAQNENTFTLTAESLENDAAVELDKLEWKYHAGDDARWADPQFDDSSWEIINSTRLPIERLPKSGWQGIGWFRLRVRLDGTAADVPLVFEMSHWGASEIFVDGVLVKRFGVVGARSAKTEQAYNPNKTQSRIALGSTGGHLIAVRHSSAALRDPTSGWSNFLSARAPQDFGVGFELRISKLDSFLSQVETIFYDYRGAGIASGLFFAVGILFLLIYGFYPREKVYLFFGLFILSYGLYIYAVGTGNRSHDDIAKIVLLRQLIFLLIAVTNVTFLAFLYVTLAARIPRQFWIFLAASIAWLVINFAFPNSKTSLALNVLIASFILIESLRLTVQALRKGVDGAWIVGIGVLLQASSLTRVILGLSGFPLPPGVIAVQRQISTYGLVIVISIFLARRFARTNKRLETELERVKELSEKELQHERDKVEYERRAKELEEARQLQLSMLPKILPQLPNLEIAAYMKPATEVGGDYYDFHVADDGTLTVAIGDATGHGLKAGTMVTAAKTLFSNLAHQPDISQIFKQSSFALKKMNLRGLYMAMAMVKIKDRNLSVSAAGMPPMLVYRAATRQVEEIAIKAMPLGSISNFPYRQQELNLAEGDTVVLMSDGFPEMFNEQGEILDYGRAKTVLEEVADKSPQEIIEFFVRRGAEWGGTRPQDDDVTFVVLKVKDGSLSPSV